LLTYYTAFVDKDGHSSDHHHNDTEDDEVDIENFVSAVEGIIIAELYMTIKDLFSNPATLSLIYMVI